MACFTLAFITGYRDSKLRRSLFNIVLSLVYENEQGKLSANCSRHPPIIVLITFAMHNKTVNQFVSMRGGIERKVNSG